MGRSASGSDASASGQADEQPEHNTAVADFHLDRFEVTVGRFRKFVEQYSGANLPEGAGKSPQIPSSGWQSEWNSVLPATQAVLSAALKCEGNSHTWTDQPGGVEGVPINCVTWFEAFAFCIWDGGRLPTEAEWEYAAAGGINNRLYPWGDAAIGTTKANYVGSGNSPFIAVGSYPAGQGLWGHDDLAGSMYEWVIDWYDADWYAGSGNQCDNCANLINSVGRGVRGGGYYYQAGALRAAGRTYFDPGKRVGAVGFRCARS